MCAFVDISALAIMSSILLSFAVDASCPSFARSSESTLPDTGQSCPQAGRVHKDLGSERMPCEPESNHCSSKALWIQLFARLAIRCLQLTRAEFRSCKRHRNGSFLRRDPPDYASYIPS